MRQERAWIGRWRLSWTRLMTGAPGRRGSRRRYVSRLQGNAGSVRWKVVVLKAPSHADHVIDGVSDVPVELHRGRVRRADLQVHLRAAELAQPSFCLVHEHPAQPLPLMARMDREVVDPPPVALVADHHGSDQFVIDQENQKISRVPRQLAVNVPGGVVPGSGQLAEGPKRNESLPVPRLVLPKHASHECCLAGAAWPWQARRGLS
jgi:hypothetical protein